MVNPEEQQSASGQRIDDVDPSDQENGPCDSISVSSSNGKPSASMSQSVTGRLTEIIAEDGDGDLLLQRNNREDGVLQWLRALDMQVMGACRADERLKPLLKLSTTTDVAEDPLVAHLSQHFEPVEVGLLARCLCVPLVSIRVGKINKEGTHLFPTSTRGNLCLTLLPTSDLRISFNGDDGSVERLATLSSEAQCSEIEIEEISVDKSERSFLIKTSGGLVSYFWCSEKSKLLGKELLRKMKDLLIKKPSLAELSGISDSRLNCFATHFRAYLAGSVLSTAEASGILSAAPSDDRSEIHFPQSSSNCQQSLRQYGSQGSRTNLIYQGSFLPRLNSFKEAGLQKGLSSIRSAAREKFTHHEERGVPGDNVLPILTDSTDPSGSDCCQKDELSEANGANSFALLNLLDAIGKSTELPHVDQEILVPSSGPSPFSPQYCWCPPVGPAAQYSPQVPISSTESSTLPPLSSLLSSTRPSILLSSKPLLNLVDFPPIDFPSFPPEPLVRLPASQQISTFTPMICDPIVHIPVIDICSSGQGYLVSAGSAISTTIPPLNPNIVDPLLPNTESVVEKNARETLRMLISGSSNQPNAPLLEVLPCVLDKENVLVAGSRGLYGGTQDVAITNGLSTVGLILFSEGGGINKGFGAGGDDLMDPKENHSTSGP